MSQWLVRLTRSAEQDIADIVHWTVINFGSQQALLYAELIRNAITELANCPSVLGAKPRAELGQNAFTLHVARQGNKGRHFVIFRTSSLNFVDVLRVLHDSMDLQHHVLPDDLQH
jgi:toxin ParE1/3/4